MSTVGRLLGYLIGLAIVVGAFWLTWRLGQVVFSEFTSQEAVALVTVVVASATAFLTFVKTKEKEVEARLFPEKAQVFQEILDVMQAVMMKDRSFGTPISDDEVARRLTHARHKLMVWGSGDAVAAVEEIEDLGSGEIGDLLAKLAYMYGCFRRDLGHKDNAYTLARISAQLIIADERGAAYEALINSQTFKKKLLPKFGGSAK